LGPNLYDGFSLFRNKPHDASVKPILLCAEDANIAFDQSIVTWRGNLTKILCTPFLPGQQWAMNCRWVDETLLMEDGLSREPMTRNSFVGFKFETLCMVPHNQELSKLDEGLRQRLTATVSAREEYGVIVEVNLGEIKFLLGAEVDGLDTDGKTFIELKTMQNYKLDAQPERMLKYWLQSKLAGVPEILLGIRERSGRLIKLERYRVAALEGMLRHRGWDPMAVFAFGEQLFGWLSIVLDDQRKPFRLEYKGNRDYRHIELSIFDQ